MKRKNSQFNTKKCVIPDIWCGDGDFPSSIKDNKRYVRNGTRTECLKKGVGVGIYQSENFPSDSLRKIKYIGKKHSVAFATKKITTTRQLITKIKELDTDKIKELLENVLTKSDGVVDQRAYNSILLFLYTSGIDNLPMCKKIKINI